MSRSSWYYKCNYSNMGVFVRYGQFELRLSLNHDICAHLEYLAIERI